MKVFLCLHHFFPNVIGGTEVYTLNLASFLKRNGIEPVVVIPNFGKEVNIEYNYNDVRVICYAENSIEDRKMILGRSKPEGVESFAELVRKEKPDLIHFHELAPGRGFNVYHVEKVKQLNIPALLTIHLSYYTCLKGTLIYNNEEKCDGRIMVSKCTECMYNEKNITGIKFTLLKSMSMLLYRLGIDSTKMNNSFATALGFPFIIESLKKTLQRLSKSTDRIIVLSNWYKKVLEKNGLPENGVQLIKQGIPGFNVSKKSNKGASLPVKIAYVGRISEQKGIHILIEAFDDLSPDAAELSIYGPEPDIDFARKCRDRTNNKRNILWKGIIPTGEVKTVLSDYDILCHPSLFEMSPLIIQEAFAAGIPVLASDIYGNAELIKDGENGWLFQFKNISDLNRKLNQLIKNPKEIDLVKKNIVAPNSFDVVGMQHLDLYNEVILEKAVV